MKDIDKVEAFNQMNISRQLIHERKQRIAKLWWKHWALRKIIKAAKKGKNKVRILSPIGCASEICGILIARKFHYNTYRRDIFFIDVWIKW